MVRELGYKPLLEGAGEFGPGCTLEGTACNVVQNHLCALALEAGCRWAQATQREDLATDWLRAATTLRQGIARYLVAKDGGWLWCVTPTTMLPDPAVLNHVINRGFGGINGVAAMHADVHGFVLQNDIWRHRCEATFNRLLLNPQRTEAIQRWGLWTQFDALAANGNPNSSEHPGELTSPSYGHGYATQTMLLFDRLDLATLALNGLAEHTYDKGQQRSPYYFYERMYAPPRPLAARDGCGELNLVCVCEPLKVARLLVGLDDHDPAHPAWIPRLGLDWTGVEFENWPFLTAGGWRQLDGGFARQPDGLNVRLRVQEGELPELLVHAAPGTKPHRFTRIRQLETRLPLGT